MSDEVVKSLNLADLDDVEFIEEVEQSFNIWFGEGQLPFQTIGDLTAAVAAELAVENKHGRCATSMAFYRLRRALQATSGFSPRPDTPLAEVLGRNQKRWAKELEAQSGLRIHPPNLSWRGGIGCLGVMVAALCVLVQPFGSIALLGEFALLLVGLLVVKLDPGRYPQATVGEFVQAVATANAGLLIAEGADTRPQAIAKVVVYIASQKSGIPAERIGSETAIFPLRTKNAA
jgi:hypothetical protein